MKHYCIIQMGNIIGSKSNKDTTVPTIEPVAVPTPAPTIEPTTVPEPVKPNAYITINTYWRNLPPDSDVYWMYSCRNDKNSYYFMSAADCMKLETAYISGEESCILDYGDKVTVNFNTMMQSTACNDCHRHVQRLSKNQYDVLKNMYDLFFQIGKSYWALNCKSGYILYSPELQTIIDNAHNNDKAVEVRVGGVSHGYTYTIDPYAKTQYNNVTRKTRTIDNITLGKTTKPIYGSFLTKIAAYADQSNTDQSYADQSYADQSYDEQSCIYTESACDKTLKESCIYGPPSTEDCSIDESCIYDESAITSSWV
jgi:hypothetical protein